MKEYYYDLEAMSEIQTPILKEHDQQVREIGQRFFDAIDAELELPAFIGHFVSEMDCHETLREDLLAVLGTLCELPESTCTILNEQVDDSTKVILKSESGNYLLEQQLKDDGRIFGRNYIVASPRYFAEL